MISHMPIESPINSIQENTLLTQSIIWLLGINDYALYEKILTWLFEHNEDDESYDEEDQELKYYKEDDPAIISIVHAFE